MRDGKRAILLPVKRLYARQLGNVLGANAAIAFGPPNPPLTKIRWYFAAARAKPFPGTIWASALYLDPGERADCPIGVDPFAPTRWDRGNTPLGAAGQKFCGKLEDFQAPGVYVPGKPPNPRARSGLPLCCTTNLTAAIAFTSAVPIGGALALVYTPFQGTRGPLVLTAYNTLACSNSVIGVRMRVTISAPGQPFDGAVVDAVQGSWPFRNVWAVVFPFGFGNGVIDIVTSGHEQFTFSFVYLDVFSNLFNLGILPVPATTAHCSPFALQCVAQGYENGVPAPGMWTFTVIQGF